MKRPLEFGQDAPIFPGTKVMVNGARAREVAGQEAPLATGAQQVKDRAEDGTKVGGARPSAGPCGRQVRGDPGPGGVVEVGVVGSGAHALLSWRRGARLRKGGTTSQTSSEHYMEHTTGFSAQSNVATLPLSRAVIRRCRRSVYPDREGHQTPFPAAS